MSRRRFAVLVTLALAAGTLAGSAAEASRPVVMPVTGRVSEVRGEDVIVVDGKSYRVLPGSPAAHAIARVHAGQVVDLVFNADASQASSRVISITLHEQP